MRVSSLAAVICAVAGAAHANELDKIPRLTPPGKVAINTVQSTKQGWNLLGQCLRIHGRTEPYDFTLSFTWFSWDGTVSIPTVVYNGTDGTPEEKKAITDAAITRLSMCTPIRSIGGKDDHLRHLRMRVNEKGWSVRAY